MHRFAFSSDMLSHSSILEPHRVIVRNFSVQQFFFQPFITNAMCVPLLPRCGVLQTVHIQELQAQVAADRKRRKMSEEMRKRKISVDFFWDKGLGAGAPSRGQNL